MERVNYNTLHARIMLFRDRKEYEMLMKMSPYSLDNQIGWTMMDGDTPICFLLISPLNPRTCEIHFFASVFLNSKFSKEALRFFKDVMTDIRKQYKRIQATVDSNNKRNIKFAEKMGFTVEGILNGFAEDGSDYLMMAQLSENSG